MSAIFRDADGHPTGDFAEHVGDRECNICGGRSDAMWMGPSSIYVCCQCAVETLPRLVADAVSARIGEGYCSDWYERYERETRGHFWKGVASAVGARYRHLLKQKATPVRIRHQAGPAG